MRSNLSKALLVIAVVTAIGGALRFVDISRPQRKVFDEVYYASDGCWYAGIEYRTCGLDDDVERSWVHPPLGKVMIGWGIDAFGNRPFGWRFSAAVAGTLVVALTAILALLLTGSAVWAGVGGLLAATEHLSFVQSRIAMVDVFLALFVVLGFVFLVADRRRREREMPVVPDITTPPEERIDAPVASVPVRRFRPLLLAAGASFGAAAAVKWSGAFALLGAIGLVLGWERTHRKRAGLDLPFVRALRQEALPIALWLAIVPVLVYVAAWIPWLADRGFDMLELVGQHTRMAEFHLELSSVKESGEPVHPYMSGAWSWLLVVRPVAYYWKGTDTTGAEILGMGHPLVFWGALVVIPYLVLRWRRDWVAGAVVVPIAAQYLPWLAASRPLFLFYMTPVAPFLALGLTVALRDLAARRGPDRAFGVAGAAVVVVVAVAVFAFFWPVLVGETIPMSAWRRRMWLGSWI